MQIKKKHPRRPALLFLVLILVLGGMFRYTGLLWDANTHLHPDERFLTMVASQMSWPDSLSAYLDTATSKLNPHNLNFSFYVYGTWPVIAAKSITDMFHSTTYDKFLPIARGMVATIDLSIIILVYGIGLLTTGSKRGGLFAAFLYSVSVLPIQVAHFFAVDVFATWWTTFAILLLTKLLISKGASRQKQLFSSVLLALSCAYATAAKVSYGIIVPFVLIGIVLSQKAYDTSFLRKIFTNGILITVFLLTFFLTLRLVYPYAFDGTSLNPKIMTNFRELSGFNDPRSSFPPSYQWIGTAPLWFSLSHLFIVGLGLPYGMLFLGALVLWTASLIKKTYPSHMYMLGALIIIIFVYQSSQFAKAMRYLLSLYPLIAVFTAWFWTQSSVASKIPRLARIIGILMLLVWPIAYLAIYTKPNTRVSASFWVYEHIPKTHIIAWEHWDDPLPLSIGSLSHYQYKTLQLPMFNPDDRTKWIEITNKLFQSNVIILSSNRVYGAAGQASQKLPITNRYYQKLFDGSLGYTLAAQFVSRPTLPLPGVSYCIPIPGFSYGHLSQPLQTCQTNGISLVDDYLDETYTVYDHPKVLIFTKDELLSAERLYQRIMTQN